MAKKKAVNPEASAVWEGAILILSGTDAAWDNKAQRINPGLGETATCVIAASVRTMTYEDYRRDCDLVAKSYVRRPSKSAIALEIKHHRRHKDGDPDAPAPPVPCANWTAAHAWADALEAVTSGG